MSKLLHAPAQGLPWSCRDRVRQHLQRSDSHNPTPKLFTLLSPLIFPQAIDEEILPHPEQISASIGDRRATGMLHLNPEFLQKFFKKAAISDGDLRTTPYSASTANF
jgi:hypothetical protein